jgi:hypothetical protein
VTLAETPRWKILVLTALVVVALFLSLTAGYRLLAQRMADNLLFSVLVADRQLVLDGRTLEQFNRDLAELSLGQKQAAAQQLDRWLDQWVDGTYALAIDAVPGYMDWYYSMPGSYLRLFHAVRGDLDQVLQGRLSAYLIEGSGLEERLGSFDAALSDELRGILEAQRVAVGRELLQRYESRQAQADAESVRPELRLNIDSALHQAFSASATDIERWQVSAQASTVAGAGTLVLVARRVMLPRLMGLASVQGARQAVVAFTARLAPRLATAIAAGGGTAVAASPTGPGALLAGAAVFATAAGTIVVTDYALLKAEEAALRPDKERELVDELERSREATRTLLREHMHAAVSHAEGSFWIQIAQPYEQAGVGQRFHILDLRPKTAPH